MTCVCGHPPEDHDNETGPCSNENGTSGINFCFCVMFEDKDDGKNTMLCKLCKNEFDSDGLVYCKKCRRIIAKQERED